MAKQRANGFGIGFDLWLLGLEVAQVMWLRTWLIALGGSGAEREARRMVEEKVLANALYGWRVVSGQGGFSPEAVMRAAMGHYGPTVRANRRRLSAV